MKKFLEKFASFPRVAGHPSDLRAQEMIKEEVNKHFAGDSFTQEFPFLSWESEQLEVYLDEKKIPCLPVLWSGSGTVEGKISSIGKKSTYSGAYEFESLSIDDKAFLLSRNDRVWIQPLDEPAPSKVYAMIFPEDLRRIKQDKTKNIKIISKSTFSPSSSANIICRNNNSSILLTAHFDSVPDSPGANDNAAGVAVLLEIMKRYPQVNLDYIFFGAEEWNLSGSKFWKDRNKKKYSLAINIDMIASPGGKIAAFTEENHLAEKIKSQDSSMEIYPYIGSQLDAFSLMQAKLPTISFGSYPYPECHYPSDTLDRLDFGKIEKMVSIVGKVLANC